MVVTDYVITIPWNTLNYCLQDSAEFRQWCVVTQLLGEVAVALTPAALVLTGTYPALAAAGIELQPDVAQQQITIHLDPPCVLE